MKNNCFLFILVFTFFSCNQETFTKKEIERFEEKDFKILYQYVIDYLGENSTREESLVLIMNSNSCSACIYTVMNYLNEPEGNYNKIKLILVANSKKDALSLTTSLKNPYEISIDTKGNAFSKMNLMENKALVLSERGVENVFDFGYNKNLDLVKQNISKFTYEK